MSRGGGRGAREETARSDSCGHRRSGRGEETRCWLAGRTESRDGRSPASRARGWRLSNLREIRWRARRGIARVRPRCSRDAMSYTDSQLLDLLPASSANSPFLSLSTPADANLSHTREDEWTA